MTEPRKLEEKRWKLVGGNGSPLNLDGPKWDHLTVEEKAEITALLKSKGHEGLVLLEWLTMTSAKDI